MTKREADSARQRSRSTRQLLIFSLVAGVLISGVWKFATPLASAVDIIVHVEPDAVCGGEPICFATVQDAVDEAEDGDRVRIADGFYDEDVMVANPGATFAVDGGWDESFSADGKAELAISSAQVPGMTTLRSMTILQGTVRIDGDLNAPVPTASPGPSPTPSLSPVPTKSPTPSPSATPSPSPSPSPTPSPPPIPPDPSEVAPPNDLSAPTTLQGSTEFLYSGEDPIQTGVGLGIIDPKRVTVLRGIVFDAAGDPLPGVTVTVKQHAELGQTVTRNDGMFDIAVNGGGPVVLEYQKKNFVPAQRRADTAWNQYVWLPDLHLIPYDALVTNVDLASATPIQVVRGSVVSDPDGTRQATLLIAGGTTAVMVMPNGSQQPVTKLAVRATEYSVGTHGPERMPMPLPPSSGYTYAVEYSVDQVLAQGGIEVRFNQPVFHYVENFLSFPVGMAVPSGYYDRQRALWVPSDNGRVVAILSETRGAAVLDVDGTGQPATPAALTALGITSNELARLAELYEPGATLWRVPITHFTPWDCNWPRVSPADAEAPTGLRKPSTPPKAIPTRDETIDFTPENAAASAAPIRDKQCLTRPIVEPASQVLREDIPIVGTPYSLHYASDRVRGRSANELTIPLSGPSLPASLERIDVEIQLAGRRVQESFVPEPNLATTFEWDGLDAYGRVVQGAQLAQVRVGYVYPAEYAAPAAAAQAFAKFSNVAIDGNRAREEITLLTESKATLSSFDVRSEGLGGWTLSTHHVLDPIDQVLLEGNGRRRSIEVIGRTIETAAGNGNNNFSGDGGSAKLASIRVPNGVAVDASGNLFIADTRNNRIRRVDAATGVITTIAGTGMPGFSGDGGPATQAVLREPNDVAVDQAGNVFFSERLNRRVRRIDAVTGIITTFAGTGTQGTAGDGGPATQAQLIGPLGLAVSPEGHLAIVDSVLVRRVDAVSGIITTVAGGGTSGMGDGGLATLARLSAPQDVAIDSDGKLYIADFNTQRIRVVDATTGIIRTIAGNGDGVTITQPDGDGGLASDANLSRPVGVAVDASGNVFIADSFDSKIRRIDASTGIITTFAGTGASNGALGEGGPAQAASLSDPEDVAVDAKGNVFIVETGRHRVRRVGGSVDEGVASQDGRALYGFDPAHRHVATLNTLTGALISTFSLDGAGRLSSIEDATGLLTTVEREANGDPTAIVAPFGQETTLTLDDNGYLASVTNPAGETIEMTYDVDGLVMSLKNARHDESTIGYDDTGRLESETDPAGGAQTLVRSGTSNTWTVTLSTALNRVATFLTENLGTADRQQTETHPDGTSTVRVFRQNGSRTTARADGADAVLSEGPDPRFGMSAPVKQSSTFERPGGLVSTIVETRTAVLSDASDPLSLTSLTETSTVNGKKFMREFSAATKTFTLSTPKNRHATATVDDVGRLVASEVSGLNPVTIAYDPVTGLPASLSSGSGATLRSLAFEYDEGGYLEQITDPVGRVTSFEYDLAGRLTKQTLPGNREVLFDYDPDGNLSSLSPPGRPAHSFSYSARDQLTAYVPPLVGQDPEGTTYEFDLDARLKHVVRPDGREILLAYDTAGRLMRETRAAGDTTYTYDTDSGLLDGITTPGGDTLAYEYDGPLRTSTTFAGTAVGTVSRSFDQNLSTSAIGLNGEQFTYEYDVDGLLTKVVGPGDDLNITRNTQKGGLISKTALGDVVDERTYNGFGELDTYVAKYDGPEIFKDVFLRDALGRITQKAETIAGTTITYAYAYDDAGRLAEVRHNGVAVATYTHDPNGNRLTGPGVSTPATYDEQDRLLQYGNSTFTHTAAGELETGLENGALTSFAYDERGRLISVTLPDARVVTYIYDGENRRIAKAIDGQIVQRFLYQDDLKPIAEVDGSGQIVRRFIYAEHINVPAYIKTASATYRVITDHLGSPRLVVNVATGAIAERIDYDAFGMVTADTNPGLQPFGFAGGLYDADTRLVRFGTRDYDARTGRFLQRDPVGFAGGSENLYAYAGSDPVNLADPDGRLVMFVGSGASVGEGLAFSGEVGVAIDKASKKKAVRLCLGAGTGAGLSFGAGREKLETGTVESGFGGSIGSFLTAEAAFGMGTTASLEGGWNYSDAPEEACEAPPSLAEQIEPSFGSAVGQQTGVGAFIGAGLQVCVQYGF